MIKNHKLILTCVGGRLIYDIIKALTDANDYSLTLIGIDQNSQAHEHNALRRILTELCVRGGGGHGRSTLSVRP